MKQHLTNILVQLTAFLPKLFTALVILIIGIVLIKIVVKLTSKALSKSRLDLSLHAFFRSSIKVLMYALVAIICASSLGIQTGSFLAVLGAVGLAASLAVKDSLANLASGLLILITHPFRVGDFIETDGVSGKVTEIGLIYTRLNTPDNKQIFLPNGTVTTAKIINYSAEETRRLDLTFSIGYSDDVDHAKSLLADIVTKHPLTLHNPDPIIRVCSHSANSVDIATRVWVKTDDYWDVNYDLHEQVKAVFDAEKISIPFPQLDVHIRQGDAK